MIMFTCSRKGERYRNYNLSIGDLYGRDDASPFVCKLEYAKEEKTGLHASVRLLRLDMAGNRNWYEVWETSETTRAIVRIVLMQGRSLRPIARYRLPNRCSQVFNPRGGNARVYH